MAAKHMDSVILHRKDLLGRDEEEMSAGEWEIGKLEEQLKGLVRGQGLCWRLGWEEKCSQSKQGVSLQ